MSISFEDWKRAVEVHSFYIYSAARILSVPAILESLSVALNLKYMGLSHLNVQSPDAVMLE